MTDTIDCSTETRLSVPTVDHWINGHAVSPAGDNRQEGTNPATGVPTTMIASGTEEDVNAAVTAAAAAAAGWRWMPSFDRGRLLNDLARALRANAGELADLESRDTGKPRHVSLAEVETSAQYFEFYRGLTGLPVGDTLDIAPDQHVYTLREPYGVIGVITPWNVPLTQAARAAAPALTAGNTVVLKPAETSSSTTVALARLATQVGIPDGVLNVVTGSGRVVGTTIVQHPQVGKVAFTGSVPTGRTIGHLAAERIIPVTLELGSKYEHYFRRRRPCSRCGRGRASFHCERWPSMLGRDQTPRPPLRPRPDRRRHRGHHQGHPTRSRHGPAHHPVPISRGSILFQSR